MQKRWKAAGIVILTLVCGLFLRFAYTQRQADRRHQADTDRFDREIAQARKDLPPGTTRVAVNDYAKQHHLFFVDGGKNSYITYERISSNAWFCSFWNAEAHISFSNESPEAVVQSIEPHTPGECL